MSWYQCLQLQIYPQVRIPSVQRLPYSVLDQDVVWIVRELKFLARLGLFAKNKTENAWMMKLFVENSEIKFTKLMYDYVA